MILISVSGYKDSGKTSLCRVLISALSSRGFKVGYIKRTQEFVASFQDTDSGAALSLGVDALLWGEGSFRYERLEPDGWEMEVRRVAGMFFPDVDIVILEGGKELDSPKIWVRKEGEALPDYPGIFAVYDRHGGGDGSKVYGKDDIERLVDEIASLASKNEKSARVFLEEGELPMKGFVADFVAGGIRGMLGALKVKSDGWAKGDVRVYLKGEKRDGID